MVAPTQFERNYEDFEPLTITCEEREILSCLRQLATVNNVEYCQVSVGGAWSEPFTSGIYYKVAVDKTLTKEPHTNLYHAHTNSTCLSAEDLMLLTNPNIEKIAVVTRSGDVFVASSDDNFRPDKIEYMEAVLSLASEANMNVLENPKFEKWTLQERTYMAIREEAFLIARHFKWKLEGGSIL